MTLIASIKYDDLITMLVGDVLATTDRNICSYVAIPASNNINSLLAAAGRPRVVKLVQKLNLLSDKLCVAVAGDSLQAKNFIEILSHIANVDYLSDELVERTIAAIQPSEMSRISFILLFVQDDPEDPVRFKLRTGQSPNISCARPYHSVVTARAGTGGEAFDRLCEAIDWTTLESYRDEYNPRQIANGIGLQFATQFVGREYLTGENLASSWGGGIEIVTLNDDKLVKLDNIVHLFLRLIVDDETEQLTIRIINKFVKYQYHEDMLLIRVLEIENPEAPLHIVDNVYGVLPILKSINDYDASAISKPDYSCEAMCLHIDMPEPGSFSNMVFQNAQNVQGLVIEYSSREFLFEISEELRSNIEEVISNDIGMEVQIT